MGVVLAFGGTFDPIHNGHLRTATDVAELLGVAQVRLIPCGQPAHRSPPVATAAQRLKMLQLAVEGQAGFVIDTQELARSGPSYMVDTAANLRAELGQPCCICLMMGLDAFLGLPNWYQWQKIPEYLNLVVMERPGWQGGQHKALQSLLAQRQVTTTEALLSAPAGKILLVTVSKLAISASQIREKISTGESAEGLLPEAVLELIKTEKIYQNQA
ncbi:Nicotinate-nucleotide adenylyltransferase [hydrothermal vent metagenome]|uniref:Nicotinate-nucleotide adenylyltransferase n=1 Tax=hydrothermal vent metagenome TaxID=652676 RepID=A0A3B0ZT82_9ZZZZ